MSFDTNFKGRQVLALGTGKRKGMRVELPKVIVEVAFFRKGRGANLARERLKFEVDRLKVLLKIIRITKNTRAFKACPRGSIAIFFDNILWMKFVNVMGELRGRFKTSGAVFTSRI